MNYTEVFTRLAFYLREGLEIKMIRGAFKGAGVSWIDERIWADRNPKDWIAEVSHLTDRIDEPTFLEVFRQCEEIRTALIGLQSSVSPEDVLRTLSLETREEKITVMCKLLSNEYSFPVDKQGDLLAVGALAIAEYEEAEPLLMRALGAVPKFYHLRLIALLDNPSAKVWAADHYYRWRASYDSDAVLYLAARVTVNPREAVEKALVLLRLHFREVGCGSKEQAKLLGFLVGNQEYLSPDEVKFLEELDDLNIDFGLGKLLEGILAPFKAERM